MRESSGRGERPGHIRRRSPAVSPAGSRRQTPPVSSSFAGVLALQRLAGNAAVTRALSVQRSPRGRQSSGDNGYDSDLAYGDLPGSARRRRSQGEHSSGEDSYNSDLAYGPSPGPSEPTFSGSVGGVHFSANRDGRLMGELAQFISHVAPHFARELAAAGSVTVRFGRTQGGGVGEWRADSRTVMLDPSHAAVRRAGSSRLFGAAVFELLNASAEPRRADLDREVLSGHFDHRAAQAGMPPEVFYGRCVEYIEWQNSVTHRRIVAALGRSGTNVDLFSGSPGDFESYYQRQVGSHTHSYEFRYRLLRVQAQAAADRDHQQQAHHQQQTHHQQQGSYR